MARSPAWFDRIDDLIDQVRTSPLDYLGRKEISALFGFQHDRDGFRLLEKFGAENVENRLSLPRKRLLAELEAIRSGPAYAAWLNNRTESRETAPITAGAGAEALPGAAAFCAVSAETRAIATNH